MQKYLLLVIGLWGTALPAFAQTSTGKATLKWQDTSAYEDGTRIWQKEGTGAWVQVGSVGANIVTWTTATALKVEVPYVWHVVAFNAVAQSAPSNEVSAAIPAAPSNLTVTSP
jgi:hypothetical protein